MKVEFTGERYLPGKVSGATHLEHLHRYALACRLAPGKSVLDIACGEGYGSALLRTNGNARSVIGVDVDPPTVERAQSRYGDLDGVSFEISSADVIPLPDSSVELAVSFETIEHHDKHEAMIAELSRVLTPRGVLILSSPNRPIYSEKRGYKNPFHIKELDGNELLRLLRGAFPAVQLWGQKSRGASFIYSVNLQIPFLGDGVDTFSALSSADDLIVREGMYLEEPAYFIAVCAKEEKVLSELRLGSLSSVFAEPDDDLIQAEITRISTEMASGYENELRHVNTELEKTQSDYREARNGSDILIAELKAMRVEVDRLQTEAQMWKKQFEQDRVAWETVRQQQEQSLSEWENSRWGRMRRLTRRWEGVFR
jgi:SAM-dependent methyltransferase